MHVKSPCFNFTVLIHKWVRRLLLFFSWFFLFNILAAQPTWKTGLLEYINVKLLKPDGAYGWEDQYDSHLTPTYAVIGILNDLGELPGAPELLAEYINSHHPQGGIK